MIVGNNPDMITIRTELKLDSGFKYFTFPNYLQRLYYVASKYY